ncbi:MAG: hypothetical protein Hens2KO_02770 [Henriciella sp.]
MKRARHSLSYLGLGTCILIVVTLLMPSQVEAQSARFTIIDARDGMTPEVVEAYAKAMGANAETALVRSRIKVLTSSRHGFDAASVQLPDHVREADIDVTVLVQQEAGPTGSIDANHIHATRNLPQRIKQTTHIQGH